LAQIPEAADPRAELLGREQAADKGWEAARRALLNNDLSTSLRTAIAEPAQR